jgi:spermidine synthase
VEIKVQDAIAYLKNTNETFDIIIIDSTDPIGPSLGLFTQSFYADVHKCLSPEGIVTAQTESFYIRPDHVRSVVHKFKNLYPHVVVYNANIPTYPTGCWSFTLGSKAQNPLTDWSQERAEKLEPDLKYYNRKIHQAAFAIPNIFRRWIDV